MKKYFILAGIIITSLVILLILIMYLQGAIFYHDSYEPKLHLIIVNDSKEKKNITITIYNEEQEEIYNDSITINGNQYVDLGTLTKKKGDYKLNAYVNETIRIDNEAIFVKENYAEITIEFGDTGIIIYQEII